MTEENVIGSERGNLGGEAVEATSHKVVINQFDGMSFIQQRTANQHKPKWNLIPQSKLVRNKTSCGSEKDNSA